MIGEPAPKVKEDSPRMRKLAKAISYFLTGEYDKINDAEEESGEGIVDMESIANTRNFKQNHTQDADDWLNSNIGLPPKSKTDHTSLNEYKRGVEMNKQTVIEEPEIASS